MENKTPAQALYEKLCSIQVELNAPKSKTNTFGKYNYRSAEDILEAVKPHLKKNGVVLTITDDLVEMAGRVYIKATAKLSDGIAVIETQAFAREPEDKKGSDQAQVTGASSSYARKYALSGLFCIDDNKDPDTNEWREEKNAKAQKNQQGPKDTHEQYWNEQQSVIEPPPPPARSIPTCTDCGRPITAHGKWKVETIAKWSQDKLGSVKCWDCISKYAKNKEEENTNA